jgi:hypothetical protein
LLAEAEVVVELLIQTALPPEAADLVEEKAETLRIQRRLLLEALAVVLEQQDLTEDYAHFLILLVPAAAAEFYLEQEALAVA